MAGAPCPKIKQGRLTPYAEEVLRRVVVQEVHDRDRGVCQGKALVPSVECTFYGWTAHEVVQRSVRPQSHLEPDLCVWICGAHHNWCHDNLDDARKVGLIRDSWEVDADGQLKPMEERGAA